MIRNWWIMKNKLERFLMKGWITEKQLSQCIVFTKKPKEKCIEVLIEFKPIKVNK
jgi:hypothetical protein